MNTENFLDAVFNNDDSAVKGIFSSLLASKISDALDVKKVEVASTLITPRTELDLNDE